MKRPVWLIKKESMIREILESVIRMQGRRVIVLQDLREAKTALIALKNDLDTPAMIIGGVYPKDETVLRYLINLRKNLPDTQMACIGYGMTAKELKRKRTGKVRLFCEPRFISQIFQILKPL